MEPASLFPFLYCAACGLVFMLMFVAGRSSEPRAWRAADWVVIAWGALFTFTGVAVQAPVGLAAHGLVTAIVLAVAFGHWSVGFFVLAATALIWVGRGWIYRLFWPPSVWNFAWALPTIFRREFLDVRAHRRAARGCCPGCGYDLRGLRPGVPCPECGAPRVEAAPSR